MESKNVLVSVLLMSLVIAQIQVEARSCCPNTTARNIYNACRVPGTPRPTCASLSGCRIITGSTCPPGFPRLSDNVHISGDLDGINYYCKLGCSSSVCAKIAILQTENTEVSPVEDGAIEQCTNACAAFCAKGSSSTATGLPAM